MMTGGESSKSVVRSKCWREIIGFGGTVALGIFDGSPKGGRNGQVVQDALWGAVRSVLPKGIHPF